MSILLSGGQRAANVRFVKNAVQQNGPKETLCRKVVRAGGVLGFLDSYNMAGSGFAQRTAAASLT